MLLTKEQRVQIVYFTGTGGTGRAADCFEEAFTQQGIETILIPLDMQASGYQRVPGIEAAVGLLVILYPVYALGTPLPIDEWIGALPPGNGLTCAVLPVSGGGDVWPNTGSWMSCTRQLKSKGYDPFYVRMLVMPSNVFMDTGNDLSARLIQILPQKAKHCVSELLQGVKRMPKKPKTGWMLNELSNMEKRSAKNASKYFKVKPSCIGCGWCAAKCPRKNIRMLEGRPVFGDSCVLCMRCLYGCTTHAINPGQYRSLLIKGGFSLERIVKTANEKAALPPTREKTGMLYAGIKKYLSDNNV